jgi:hypothetical protein
MAESRPPVPPFTFETATQKVRMAEDAWNTRDPQSRSHIRQIPAGEIAPNSYKGAPPSKRS